MNSSKPAADLSLWILKRRSTLSKMKRRRRKKRSDSSSSGKKQLQKTLNENESGGGDEGEFAENEFAFDDSRKLETIDSYVTKNGDLTLKSVSTSKYVVSRYDNHRLVSCVAENANLNEKWETKRILNVLCKKFIKNF